MMTAGNFEFLRVRRSLCFYPAQHALKISFGGKGPPNSVKHSQVHIIEGV